MSIPQGSVANAAPDLRPLSLDDFIQSKAKVLDQCLKKPASVFMFFFICSLPYRHCIICLMELQVSPSVAYDATTMNELRKWNEQYGEGGSRTKSPFGF